MPPEKDGFSVRSEIFGGLLMVFTIYLAAEVKATFISKVERWRLVTAVTTSDNDRWMLQTMFFDGMTLALVSARCEASLKQIPDTATPKHIHHNSHNPQLPTVPNSHNLLFPHFATPTHCNSHKL